MGFVAQSRPHQELGTLVERVQLVRFVANVSPALVEEASMRAGVVQLLDTCYGSWAGLLGGSVPFGLLHIVSRLFGQPVSVAHVLGTTIAGLLLSLLYLRFGVGAAVACHWVWNSLASAWAHYLGFAEHGGVREFEGAWQTSAVLLLLCWALYSIPVPASKTVPHLDQVGA
jgi:membrane protease YdiL (CAAX protease family)